MVSSGGVRFLGMAAIFSACFSRSGIAGQDIQRRCLPEDLQSRLVGPLVTKKEEGGTGLGLWVSSNILEKHGGNIRISNNGGPNARGTTLSIFLPFKGASAGISLRLGDETRGTSK